MTNRQAETSPGERPSYLSSRIAWLERPDDDFPYYNGKPVEITGAQWWIVMLGVAAGFAVLILPPPFLRGPVTQIVPSILFFAIPLAALAWVAPSGWTAIFRRLRATDVLLMILFAAINMVLTLAVAYVISGMTHTTSNAVIAALAEQTLAQQLTFVARTAPQLFGEEVLTILPFLALLYWFVAKRGMSRTSAVLLCWFLTAVLFGAAHLPTYGWNVLQAVVGIGIARLVLTIPYIITKNIWVSTGAHILNDWTSFGLAIFLTGAARS